MSGPLRGGRKYWGKAGDAGEFHLLPYHQLDVAAVADRLLARCDDLRNRLVLLCGLPETVLLSWIRFFLALHDVGKFSCSFQQLRADLSDAATPCFYSVRHDTLGYLFWKGRLAQWLLDPRRWRVESPSDRDYLDLVFEQWAQAVMGHHGQPPKMDQAPLSRHFLPEDSDAALHYAEALVELFRVGDTALPTIPLEELHHRSKVFSWWLAGLTVLADWLGSNRAYFRFHAEPMPLERYWREIALPCADKALDQTGLLPLPAARRMPMGALFHWIDSPTPLQAACSSLPWETGPQLFLVEDVTGAGKTEAAFVLLNRLLAEGTAQGCYLALPTMATANAMYRRTARIYRLLFQESEQPPSLVLAHGSRHLNEGFRDSVLPEGKSSGTYSLDEHDATAVCNAWLADGSKRALLGQVGVGTVDQALLAVLTSRHQSLRLLGLLGKVLVVDEVHASDTYMHRLLCELLALHGRAGGSAILLSATLPKRMRDELLNAYCGGMGRDVPALPCETYPLLTRIGKASHEQKSVPTRESAARVLEFGLFHDENTVLDWIAARAEAGECIAWVRNTVTDAVAAYRRLGERLAPENVILFHARFAMGDRLAIEDAVLEAFGPESKAEQRRGRVVVASQVIEQSLDLDFDQMVSDLAPIDLLLQRAGRLRRHQRECNGNPTKGADQRGVGTLHVLTPDPDQDNDNEWYRRLLPHAAPVYPDHGQLWLTARLLKDRGRIAVPKELRLFIEGVFGDEPVAELPQPLMLLSSRSEGQRRADASVARFNAIKPRDGYRHQGGEWWDESYTPTRLGELTTTVRLARWDGVRLWPWCDDEHHPWAMSEVRVRRALLAAAGAYPADVAEAVGKLRKSWPKAAADVVLIPLLPEGGEWRGPGLDHKQRPVVISYARDRGMEVQRN